ncbi:ABC transporter permease [Neobacillus sp. YIM B06451]|uniref:ABC transporter permease n=1 Tax=Neobacillus sp. YIM B06451 TaxID=3070994 RepID=UPI002930C1E0|nr:ABC transporter permease [Neobacillus sp. YIM B06451]
MSFSKIVWKMAKANYQKYIFYLLCNSFAVMFFFMFSTLYFNSQIVQVKESQSIQYVLAVQGAALLVFTVFFISYAHGIFIKRRKSEFGLFMTLGMSNRDITRLLLLENGIVAMLSILSGIFAGALFSGLFFTVLIKNIGIQTISLELTAKMFLSTILAYLMVFFTAVGKSLFQILKGNLLQTMKSDKVAETIKMKSPVIGGAGFAIVIVSILGLYYTYSDSIHGGDYLLIWAMATFIGLYICLFQFTSFLIGLTKKSKPFYYRGMLLLSSLNYKFRRLTSILMLVTVLIMVTILYSTLILSTYILDEKRVISENPFDIAYSETENQTAQPFFDSGKNPLKTHLQLPVFRYDLSSNDWSEGEFVFMPVGEFNKISSLNMDLKRNEYIYFANVDPQNLDVSNAAERELSLQHPNGRITFMLKETIAAKKMNNLSALYEVRVVNDTDYELLKESMAGEELKIHLLNVADWTKTGPFVEELANSLGTGLVASKIGDHIHNKQSNGILFFVSTFLSVLFCFGSFSLLYLNLFSDIDREKEKYKKLNSIGITPKEMKRNVSWEITPIFFIPMVVGTTLALLYFIAMAKDIGGIMKNQELLLHFFLVAGIYFCIQLGFFLFTRRRIYVHLTSS